MEEDIFEMDAKGLRRFALTAAGVVAGLFGIALPWLYGYSYRLWPWIAAASLALWGMLHPTGLGPIYRWWMRIANVLGRVNNIVLLAAIYVFIISPIGILMRWCGYDPLKKKYQIHASTYRKPAVHHIPNHMERTY